MGEEVRSGRGGEGVGEKGWEKREQVSGGSVVCVGWEVEGRGT